MAACSVRWAGCCLKSCELQNEIRVVAGGCRGVSGGSSLIVGVGVEGCRLGVEVAVGLRLGVEVEVGEEEAHDTACGPQQEKLPHVENCYKCATASRQQLEPKRGSAQCGAANGFPALHYTSHSNTEPTDQYSAKLVPHGPHPAYHCTK